MKTSKTIKNILCNITFVILAFGAMLMFAQTNKKVGYASNSVVSSSVSVTNSNFTTSANEKKVVSPSGYTFINSAFESVSYNPQDTTKAIDITAGTVNFENTNYNYPLNSLSSDKYGLLIDSKNSDDVYLDVKYGYKSSAFTLDTGSYYSILLEVYSANNSGLASLYLTDNNNEIFAEQEKIGVQNQWVTYAFFVSTNDVDSQTLALDMFLDGSGSVLFDNIRINKLSYTEYVSQKSTYTNKVEIDRVDNLTNINITASTFTQVGYNAKTSVDFVDQNYIDNATSECEASNNKNTTALRIENTDKTASTFKTNENFLTFTAGKVYKVNVIAKTIDLDGSVSMKLVQTGVDEGTDSSEITISADTSKNLTNNYVTYTFYVTSNPLEDTTYQLQVDFGTSSTETSGILYLSGVEVIASTTSAYTSASAGSTLVKLDLSSDFVLSSSSYALDNGNFNGITVTDYTGATLNTPSSWTVKTGNGNQTYGVINTSTFDFATAGLTNPKNPNGSSTTNNMLVMHNATRDTLSYTSTTKSLDADSYYLFDVNVFTIGAPAKLSLVATINEKEVVLDYISIDTESTWKLAKLYVHTGNQAISVALKLELNNKALSCDSYATAYFDDANYNFALENSHTLLAPTDEEEFDALVTSNTLTKVDLSNMFAVKNGDETNYFVTPDFFTIDNSNVQAGIVSVEDANKTYLSTYLLNEGTNINQFTNVTNKNILAIRAVGDTNATYTSSLGFDFEQDSYYLVSLKVYTQNLQAVDSTKLGAILKLTNFDDVFDGIVTETENGNGWVTYNFYINPDEDVTSYLQIQLCDDATQASGSLFIADIEYSTIEEDSFPENSSACSLILSKVASDDEEEETTEETTEDSGFNWNFLWYAIPSIMFAIAIILAVITVYMRKIKWHKPISRKKKSNYDRDMTLSRQYYERKATILRENNIRDMSKQLKALQEERAKYEEEYKHDLTKLRDMRIKRANPVDVAKLERDMNKNRKATAQIGVNVKKLEKDLATSKTDEYLISLTRKLMAKKIDEKEIKDEADTTK